MRFRTLVLASLLVLFVVPTTADKVPKELKQRLFERYDKKTLVCTRGGIVVATDVTSDHPYAFRAQVNYFYPGVEIPKKYLRNERLDDRAFVYTYANPELMSRVSEGERLLAYKFYVYDDQIVLSAYSNSATRVRRSLAGGEPRYFGVIYTFYFPKQVIVSGDYDAIVTTIDRYMMPEEDYLEMARERQEAAEATRQAASNVEIQPGMSKEQVVKILGDPQRTITFGNKTVLKYVDLTVELVDDKVVDVKVN